MPNWCMNALSISSESAGDLEAFVSAATNDQGGLQFSRLVPLDESKVDQSGSVLANFGLVDLAARTWGTKWDVNEDDTNDVTPEAFIAGESISTRFEFETAWSPPLGWVGIVAPLFPRVSFNLRYDEPGNDFAGFIQFENGVVVDGGETESTSFASCAVPECDEGEYFGLEGHEGKWFCGDHELEQEVYGALEESRVP